MHVHAVMVLSKLLQTEVLDYFARRGGYDVLVALKDNPKRWKEIEKAVLVSPRTLSRRIYGAMELGLINKVKHLGGGTAYRLTDKGKNALVILSEEIPGGYFVGSQPNIKKLTSATEKQKGETALMFFPRCPLCHGPQSKIKQIRQGRKDNLVCFSCGAKWHLKLKSDGSLEKARLVAEGADGQGADVLDESHEPDFWLRQALKGSTPWPDKKAIPTYEA